MFSFLISRTKKTQSELKKYGPLRLFGSGEFDAQHVGKNPNPKQIIAIYQLPKSQLIFTLAELETQDNKSIIVPKPSTSVKSIIMTDDTAVLPR